MVLCSFFFLKLEIYLPYQTLYVLQQFASENVATETGLCLCMFVYTFVNFVRQRIIHVYISMNFFIILMTSVYLNNLLD